jgi:hypothetical protein
MTFDVGYVFVGSGGVKVGIPGSDGFEFVVSEDAVNDETAGMVQGDNGCEVALDSSNTAVFHEFHSGELDIPGFRHKER